MRPFEPWMRPFLEPARRPLRWVVLGSTLAGVLVIAQAFAVTDFVVAAVHRRSLSSAAVALAAVLVARALVSLVVDAQAAEAANRVATDLRRRVLAGVLRQNRSAESAGASAALATRGVQAAEPYLTRYLPSVLLSMIVPPLVVVAIASRDPLTAAIVVATLPLVPVFGWLVGAATRDRAEAQWRAMSSLAGHFVDVMRGLPTLVAFGRADAQAGGIAEASARYRRRTMATLRIAFASSAVLELVATLSVALVAVVVGVRLATGDLDLGTGLVVLLLAPEAYAPIRRAGAEFHAAAEGRSAFEKVSAYAQSDETATGAPAQGSLLITDVSVRYPGQMRPALQRCSVRVPNSGLTVVTGRSGAGKSTLLAAIAGLVPLEAGSIAIAGAAAEGSGWRSGVAWVPQRPGFLSATVEANLRMAAPWATDQQLWEALDAVGLTERVNASELGLRMPVGEDAHALSAGERARLAFARALLGGRRWVLLDEPTASLDAETRQRIAALIVSLSRRYAVVVATHDPVLIERADHVVHLAGPAELAEIPAATRPALATEVPEEPEPARSRLLTAIALEGLASASGVALTATAGWLIVKAAEEPPVLTMLVAIVAVRAFGLGRPVLRYAGRLLGHDAALRALARRRVEVYEALVPLTPGALGRDRGDVLATAVDDVDSVVDRQLRVRAPLVSAILVALLASITALALAPTVAAVIAGTCLLGGSAAFLGGRRGARQDAINEVASRAALSSCVLEAASLGPELVMWEATSVILQRGMSLARSMAAATRRTAVSVALARSLSAVICAAGLLGAGLIGSSALTRGAIGEPELALLILMPLALVDVLQPLAEAGALSCRTSAADQRLTELTRRRPVVTDPPTPVQPSMWSELEVDEVTAGWAETVAFEDLSLRLKEGQRLAIIGPSGCGKSTLAALLVRFIDPLRGEVRLGGVGLPSLALAEVRSRVGIVDDSPYVFATSLAENMRLGRRDATDAEIRHVLEDVGLGAWVSALPHGLDSMIGEGHAGLSGGERARLAVARLLLSQRRVLVLDEPTAHLDADSADRTMAAVVAAGSGRSLVWITHGSVGAPTVDSVLDMGGDARHGSPHDRALGPTVSVAGVEARA